MQARGKEDQSILIAAIAKERSSGKKQQEIANTLRISQSEVSRLLVVAQKTGWLGEPTFKPIDPGTWQAAQERFFSTVQLCAALRKRFTRGGRQLHQITLLHAGRDDSIDAGSVDIFHTLLSDAKSVGVTWGQTLSNVIKALRLRAMDLPRRERAGKVSFVPLCGEPLMDTSAGTIYSSSVLALHLSEIFNTGDAAKSATSIAGVPAFIPLNFGNPAEVNTIRRFNGRVRGYAQVFGTPAAQADAPLPLAETLDAILTSVGQIDRAGRGIFLTERIQSGDMTEAELERSVAGDVGGVIIPKAGISKNDKHHIAEMNENWTGFRLDHLRRCADAARRGGFTRKKPGVILLALGAHRLTVVLRCIELGLVNELVIDRELEEALNADLNVALPRVEPLPHGPERSHPSR